MPTIIQLADSAHPSAVTQTAATSTSGTLQNAQAGNATGSTLTVTGNASAVWAVTMTGFTGTVTFQGISNGVTSNLSCAQLGTSTIISSLTGSTTTATYLLECSIAGIQTLQAPTSGVSAGNVTVAVLAVPVAFNPRNINANHLINGVVPGLDNTNEQKVSVYGKNSTAGDTAIAVDASGRLTLVPNQVVEIGDGTTPTQKLAIDASGRLTLVPNSSVNAAQIGGQVPTLDNTTILATSMRVKTTTAGDTPLTVGQATMANSLPVTVASNQGAIGSVVAQAVAGTALAADQSNTELRVSLYGKNSTAGDTPVLVDSTGRVLMGLSTTAAYSLASTTTSGSTQNSGDIAVGPYREISIDINTTAQAGTSPTLQIFYERKAADGIYYVLWQSAVLTTATNTLSTSIGAGMAYNQSLGATGRVRWVVGGTATPTYTMSINVQGK